MGPPSDATLSCAVCVGASTLGTRHRGVPLPVPDDGLSAHMACKPLDREAENLGEMAVES